MEDWLTKLRRLPEIDLAKIAPLSRDEKLPRLRSFNSGGGSWSYEPARKQSFNIAAPRNPLGLIVASPNIEQIRQLVRRDSYCIEQEESCIEVVDLFYDWNSANATDAIDRRLPAMAIGSLGSVKYWESFVSLIRGVPTQVFFDHRRQNGLTSLARKFVFSMMAAQARAADPDLVDAQRLILCFPQRKDCPRQIVDHYCNDADLFTIDQLTQMIEETYELWQEVLAERRIEPPKRASGGLF
jgi:hypothetical protein